MSFAREFLKTLPADGGTIATAELLTWIEGHRRTVVDERADFAEAYFDALSA